MRTDDRLPQHIGFIPDGNRRWAEQRGLPRHLGYEAGIEPGLRLLELCRDLGIEEISAYGFTKENVRRPAEQVAAFRDACIALALAAVEHGAGLLVVGDAASPVFPDCLRPFVGVRSPGAPRFNLLVNYGWQWDLRTAFGRARSGRSNPHRMLGSAGVSRVDLVVRWGGRRRLSGFLPMQCAYADFTIVDRLWPDMRPEDFVGAIEWFRQQDVTLGG